jgi:hypothetical protein
MHHHQKSSCHIPDRKVVEPNSPAAERVDERPMRVAGKRSVRPVGEWSTSSTLLCGLGHPILPLLIAAVGLDRRQNQTFAASLCCSALAALGTA